MIVAIRQALDYHSTVRAAAVSLVALGIIALLVILLGVLLGPTLS